MKRMYLLSITLATALLTACSTPGIEEIIIEPGYDDIDVTTDDDIVNDDDIITDDIEIDDDGVGETPFHMGAYQGVPEEKEGAIEEMFANTRQTLEGVSDINELYRDFLCGEAYATIEYDNGDFGQITAFSIDDEMFYGCEDSLTQYALIDVNGDGVEELYYTINCSDNFTSYKLVLGIKNKELIVAAYDGSYNMHIGSHLTSEGYWIREENLESGYYEVFKFDEDLNYEWIDGMYSSDYEGENFLVISNSIKDIYDRDKSISMTELQKGPNVY